MRILIAGLGSIGRRHLNNVRSVIPDAEIIIWHTSGRVHDEDDGCTHVGSLPEALLLQPDAAIIASPAPHHIPAATELAEHGVHLLVEKPLSHSLEGAVEFVSRCRERGITLLVGYNLRYYEPIVRLRDVVIGGRIGRVCAIRAEVGMYLPDWRPAQDYRQSVSAHAASGGGVLLELSHELDYVSWIGGQVRYLSAALERCGALDIDVEDTAEILLWFENGALGSVHMDMLQRTPTRKCKVIGTLGTAEWDQESQNVRVFNADRRSWEVVYEGRTEDRSEMYVRETKDFLQSITGQTAPRVTGDDGLRALALVEAARTSAREQRRVEVRG